MVEKKLTPMVRQYLQIKANHPEHIVMFRMGDFYEMFNDDAKIAAPILGITLTSRPVSNGERMPLAGVPWHALDTYLHKLIRSGNKVAICEQVEDPKASKGIVKREVTRVITPGTIVESTILDEKQNNFLLALYAGQKSFGLAAIDLSTGRFEITEFDPRRAGEEAHSEIWRLHPSEVLISEEQQEQFPAWTDAEMKMTVSARPESHFNLRDCKKLLCEQLGVNNLTGFGAEDHTAALQAAGAIVNYLQETQRSLVSHINSLRVYSISDYMVLDYTTQRSLELVEGIHGGREGTLLTILDQTMTSMGGRMLRQWVLQPLKDRESISARQQAIEELFKDFNFRAKLRDCLRNINDIERIISRVGVGAANARDLVALRQSLSQLPELKQLLANAKNPRFKYIADHIDPVPKLRQLLHDALEDSPPTTLKEGGLIREGYNQTVDEYRAISKDSKSWISQMRAAEIERTGIQTLKIKYNRVFGYFIEVTKAQVAQVPEDYIRKQTLVNAERYITPELKEKEEVILNAEEKLHGLEYELFEKIRDQVKANTIQIQGIAQLISEIDSLYSLAEAAIAGNYTKPEIANAEPAEKDTTKPMLIEIQDGRHPVLEAVQADPPFVPNHTYLSNTDNQVMLITGPNMAGKSTYIRQVALITLMAHIGSFVPARQATISLVDRIFTRIGAMDKISKGQSTFLVEMSETANILNNATNQSLVILDEIGRGTSTYDGLSIAWSVIEHIHNHPRCQPLTLFATHYHELISLEENLHRLKNYNVSVLEEKDRVIFLYKIERGSTDRSYGIYAAELAGVPAEVVDRAKNILQELEQGHALEAQSDGTDSDEPTGPYQLTFFDTGDNPVIEKLQNLNIQSLTPLQALNLLADLQKQSKK